MTSQHLIQLLLACPPVAAAVGIKVFAKKAPQGTDLPYLTVRQRSGGHLHAMNVSGLREGTAYPTFEIVAYGDDTNEADGVLDQVAKFLDGYKGTITIGPPPGGTIAVKGVFQQDEDVEDWLAPIHVDEVGVHYAGAVFKVWHTEQAL